MNKQQKTLLIDQLDKKISLFAPVQKVSPPGSGWIHGVRVALGMTLKQLGNRLGISPQGVKDMENREKEGAITLKSLREIGQALDMQLVYGFIPKENSLEKALEVRAKEVAQEIVMRTSQTMLLEDQQVSRETLERAILEKTKELIREMPKYLWD